MADLEDDTEMANLEEEQMDVPEEVAGVLACDRGLADWAVKSESHLQLSVSAFRAFESSQSRGRDAQREYKKRNSTLDCCQLHICDFLDMIDSWNSPKAFASYATIYNYSMDEPHPSQLTIEICYDLDDVYDPDNERDLFSDVN
ncbi:hypothetical protein ABW20_dc0100705 [Dactylellina cionopaga]|nr:hypothetical protein ABW20_dc0100705 [Dactylellina cionopaga]